MKAGYLKVGVTRSGDGIYVSFIDKVKDQIADMIHCLGEESLFDAFCIFEYLTMMEYSRFGVESEMLAYYEEIGDSLKQNFVTKGIFEDLLRNNKLVTSIDVVNHGRSLVTEEMRRDI